MVGVDGSVGSWRAVEWAAVQAERTRALLEIHTIFVPRFFFIPPDEVNDLMRGILDEATERARRVAPAVSVQSEAHDNEEPATALIEASNGADLLVVGSRGKGGFLGLALGSVSNKCSLHAHTAVVIVR